MLAQTVPPVEQTGSKTGKSAVAKSGSQPTIAPNKVLETTDPNMTPTVVTLPPGTGPISTDAMNLAKNIATKLEPRKRIIAGTVVAVVIAAVGGFLFLNSHKDVPTPTGAVTSTSGKPAEMAKQAESLYEKGKVLDAEQLAGNALKTAKDQQDLEGSIAASASLAHIYLHEYKYNDAWTYANWILDVKKQGQKVDDLDYSRALNIMGTIATLEKNYPKAHEYLNQALKIRDTFKGSYRTYYARTLASLGNLAVREGKYSEAISLLERAKDIAVQISGMDDMETQGIFNDLGQAYQFAGKLGNAEECYMTALSERKRQLSPDNPAIAESEICLAFLRARQGRTEEAVQLFERAIVIDEKAFGKNSPTVSQLCYSLAAVLDAQKKYVLAETYYREALLMRQATLKPNDPILLDTQKKYQAVLRKLKKR
jgi:tetratricopeptide (TPR) repeat protein